MNVWRQNDGTFEMMRGPVFTNILLSDEINRAPPKTQSALLEAMEERQVTIDGDTMPLGTPFVVIATQNPIEQEGTYPLPEAQLDRFLLKLSTGYPANDQLESEILLRRIQWQQDDPTADLEPAVDVDRFVELQRFVDRRLHGPGHCRVHHADCQAFPRAPSSGRWREPSRRARAAPRRQGDGPHSWPRLCRAR